MLLAVFALLTMCCEGVGSAGRLGVVWFGDLMFFEFELSHLGLVVVDTLLDDEQCLGERACMVWCAWLLVGCNPSLHGQRHFWGALLLRECSLSTHLLLRTSVWQPPQTLLLSLLLCPWAIELNSIQQRMYDAQCINHQLP